VRPLIALVVLFTMQLTAQAEDSADLSSSAAPVTNWSKDPDRFVNTRNEAKVKAMIRELLGEERPAAPDFNENPQGSKVVD
jgi:hypothetical protein